jgi:hypothetical protein
MKTQIDFGEPAEDERRTLRRAIKVPVRQAPATTAGIASPTRGATLEAPAWMADRELREAGMFLQAGEPAGTPWHNGDAAARERLAAPYFTTHDKSLPNPRRTQRGAGTCLPGPVHANPTHGPEGLSHPKPTYITDEGFSSTAMHRRGRGGASPMPLPPQSNPNTSSMAHGPTVEPVRGHGMASGSSGVDGLLGGRRARGLCSPRVGGSGNLIAWAT